MSIKAPNYTLPRASSATTASEAPAAAEALASTVDPAAGHDTEDRRVDAFSRRGSVSVAEPASAVSAPTADRFQDHGGWPDASPVAQTKALATAITGVAVGAIGVVGGVVAATGAVATIPAWGTAVGAGTLIAGAGLLTKSLVDLLGVAGGDDPAAKTVGDSYFEADFDRDQVVGPYTPRQEARHERDYVGRITEHGSRLDHHHIQTKQERADAAVTPTKTKTTTPSVTTASIEMGEPTIHEVPDEFIPHPHPDPMTPVEPGEIVLRPETAEDAAHRRALTDASGQRETLLGRSAVTGQVAGAETVRPADTYAPQGLGNGAPQAPVLPAPDTPVHDAARVHDLAAKLVTTPNAGLGEETVRPSGTRPASDFRSVIRG